MVQKDERGKALGNQELKPFRTFTSQAEREKWLIENADYFTIVFRRNLRNRRLEVSDLKTADAYAKRISEDLKLNTLIYAVSGVSDTFVHGYEWTTQGVRQKHAR
jgi:hypothetical protein